MTKLLRTIALGVLMGCLWEGEAISDDYALPLTLGPTGLASLLPDPERAIHLATASALHEEQARILQESSKSGRPSASEALTAVALALEEYWARELSYPPSCADLIASGCMEPGWTELGLSVADAIAPSSMDEKVTLAYVPQALGHTTLKPTPGKPCNQRRRCFSAYSLLVTSDTAVQWGISDALDTSWVSPFLALGWTEVLHIDQLDPGASGCATCD